MFSIKQSDGIVISFGQTLVASLWKGLWTTEHGGRHAEWISALEVQGVRAVQGQDDRVPDLCSQDITRGSVGLWI